MLFISVFLFALGTGMTPFLASSDDDEDSNDGSATDGMFKPKVAIVIGVLAALLCMTFFLVLYGRHCKRMARRLIRGDNSTSGQPSASLPGNSAVYSHRLSNLRLPYDADGLSQWLVDALPKLQTCSASSQLLESRGADCPVCLNKYAEGEVLRLLPRCKHAFHVTCVDKWLLTRPSCPICRTYVCCQDVVDLDNYYLYKNTPDLEQPEQPDVLESVQVVVEPCKSPGEAQAEAGSGRRNVSLLSFDDHMMLLSPAPSFGQLRRSASLNSLGGRRQGRSSPPSFPLAPASEVVHSRPRL